MAAQFGPHRWSAGAHRDTARFRGARVDLSGHVEGFRVNGVDVTAFVAAELDRRHPERVQLREIRDADGFRAMADTVTGLWSAAVARVEALPGPARDERVDGEWSFAETLRHLVFITDSWASRTILDEELPYHRIGLPQTAYAAADAAALGIDLSAEPTWSEVLAARADRLAVLAGILNGLTDADLGRPCTRPPAPGYPGEARAVAECLAVVLEEEIEHYRFATRDLSVLEAR
jgi:DinB superfamily